jgi:hypothetical protein
VTIALSKYVREVKALEVIAPVAVAGEAENQPSVDPDKLKVIQLPDGRFKVESR